MSKRVSIGMVIALMAVTAAVTFPVSYQMAMNQFNQTVADVNERQEMYDKLATVDQRVRQNYLGEIDEAKLRDGMCEGYLAGLQDGQSGYLTAEQYQAYLKGEQEQTVGIGVHTIRDPDGNLEVVEVIPASPAEQEGLQKGDVIIAIDGKEVKRLGYHESVAKLRGDAGSKIALDLLRLEQPEQEEAASHLSTVQITLTRASYQENAVSYRLIDADVGYVAISSFAPKTAEQFSSAVNALLEQGARGFVFDVRSCTGDSVESAAKMLDILLPAGNLIGSMDKKGEKQFLYDSDAKELNLPMSVVINSGSYGAAELFASAIKDYHKGILVGETTAGQGSEQKVFPLADGSAIRLTVGNYITPESGVFTGVGIQPEREIVLSEAQRALLDRHSLDEAEDAQLLAAITALQAMPAE